MTEHLVVVKLATSKTVTADGVAQHLSQSIKGNWVPFEDRVLAQTTDIAKIRKIYKFEPPSKSRPSGQEPVDHERKELEVIILGLMALRGAS